MNRCASAIVPRFLFKDCVLLVTNIKKAAGSALYMCVRIPQESLGLTIEGPMIKDRNLLLVNMVFYV